MRTISSALYSLARSGYRAYISVSDNSIVIEDIEGRLAKIIIRRATKTHKTPILTLSNMQKSQSYLQNYGYVLVTLPSALLSWLIPISHFPTNARTVRLGDKYHHYLLQESASTPQVQQDIIKAEVKSRVQDSVELSQDQIDQLFEIES